jgi:hypothetical protein
MTARVYVDDPALLINSLRRVAERLTDGDEHAQAAAGFLELILGGASPVEALGPTEPGQRSIATQLAIAARDQLQFFAVSVRAARASPGPVRLAFYWRPRRPVREIFRRR